MVMVMMTRMNQIFLPDDMHMIITFQDLETALALLVNPDKRHLIRDMVSALRTLNRTEGPEKALMTMISGVAWLTE